MRRRVQRQKTLMAVHCETIIKELNLQDPNCHFICNSQRLENSTDLRWHASVLLHVPLLHSIT
ncbi:hypothetical protein LINPERHAP1_LOCUS20606, partial [Linum perenne]